jgi:hypothetical protein
MEGFLLSIVPDWIKETALTVFILNHWAGFLGVLLLLVAGIAVAKIPIPATPTKLTFARIRTIKTVRWAGGILLLVELIPLFAEWFKDFFEWIENQEMNSIIMISMTVIIVSLLIFLFKRKAK